MEFIKPTKHRTRRPVPVPNPATPRPLPQTSNPPAAATAPPAPRTRRWRPTKKQLIVGGAVAAITIGVLAVSLPRHSSTTAQSNKTTDGPVENLEYQTVLPNGKTISQLGGWQRVSPAHSDPVYAYADTIGAVPISVSEQPLPAAMRSNTDSQVADLARKFNATTKLTAGNTSLYVGTSAKGPQSVILTKNDLLILIKSQEKIADSAWSNYAASLR